jgi:hypothetical protein
MNARVKGLWLEALRSGRYKQGKAHLECEGQYCCLGVLCELAVQEGATSVARRSGGYSVYGGLDLSDDVLGHAYDLPEGVARWANLRRRAGPGGRLDRCGLFSVNALPSDLHARLEACGFSLKGRRYVDLADLNDFGIRFELIAEVIDVMWP